VRVSACEDDGVVNVGIEQPAPRMCGAPTPAQLAAVLTALGLAADELDARAPPVIAGENSTRLMLALRDAAVLARLQPEMARLATLSTELGAPGFFLYTLRPAMPDCDTEARMFCPAIGINEDPVSGNAHGMLGAWLWQNGLLGSQGPRGIPAFNGAQGHHLRRPGHVAVALAIAAGRLEGVSIGGDAVVLLQSILSL
jgi:PhzF family phenazine biosynthesis protein